MINKIQLTKKTILVLTVVVFIIAVFIYITVTNSNKEIQKIPVEIVSLSPTPTSNIFTSTSSDEKLSVDWGSVKPIFENKEYPRYQTTPTLNQASVQRIGSALGFSSDSKETMEDGTTIWRQEDKILLHVPENDSLDYQNLKKYSGSGRFNQLDLINKANSFTKLLFPDLSFSISNIKFYRDNSYDPIVTDVNNSLLSEINFTQNIDGKTLIPTDLKAEYFLTLFITPDLEIQNFRNTSGLQSATISTPTSTANYDVLVKISTSNFKKLTRLPVDTEEILNSSKKLKLTVSNIDVAYTIIGKTAAPLYYIQGILFADDIKIGDDITYIAPMN